MDETGVTWEKAPSCWRSLVNFIT